MIKITSVDQIIIRSKHSKYLCVNRRGQHFIRSGFRLSDSFCSSSYPDEFFNVNNISLLESKEEVERVIYLRELIG